MDIVESFLAMGWSVRLLSTDLFEHGRWTDSSIAALAAKGVECRIFQQRSPGDHRRERWEARLDRWGIRKSDPFANPHLCPPSLLSWFEREVMSQATDLVLVTFVWWTPLGGILSKLRVPRILEIQDLVTLNARQAAPLEAAMGWRWREAGDLPPHLLAESATQVADAERGEYRALSKWPAISSISGVESLRIAAACPGSKVVHVPSAMDLPERTSNLEGLPVFPTGPNLFNLQGLHLLAAQVMPRILSGCPDAQVRITGHCCGHVGASKGLELSGFVDDFPGLLRDSRFLVSPVRGGTGLQLKILEGMAFGLPAVTLPGPFQEVPVTDGVDGFRASGTDEFADACLRLWHDKSLRIRMGEAARESVRDRHSRDRQIIALGELIRIAGISG